MTTYTQGTRLPSVKSEVYEVIKGPVRGPSPIAVHGAIFSHLFWTVILPHSGPL